MFPRPMEKYHFNRRTSSSLAFLLACRVKYSKEMIKRSKETGAATVLKLLVYRYRCGGLRYGKIYVRFRQLDPFKAFLQNAHHLLTAYACSTDRRQHHLLLPHQPIDRQKSDGGHPAGAWRGRDPETVEHFPVLHPGGRKVRIA